MTVKHAIKTFYQNAIKDIRDKIKIEKALSEPNSVEITHTNRNKNGNVKLLMLTVGNEMLRH